MLLYLLPTPLSLVQAQPKAVMKEKDFFLDGISDFFYRPLASMRSCNYNQDCQC